MPKGNWLCPGVGREKVLEQSLETLQSLVRHPSIMGIGVGSWPCCLQRGAQGCRGQRPRTARTASMALPAAVLPLSSVSSSALSSLCRIFSELNSTEMHLIIVRGMNLPAPPGNLVEGCPCPGTRPAAWAPNSGYSF